MTTENTNTNLISRAITSIKEFLMNLINKIISGCKSSLIQLKCNLQAVYDTMSTTEERAQFRMFFAVNQAYRMEDALANELMIEDITISVDELKEKISAAC